MRKTRVSIAVITTSRNHQGGCRRTLFRGRPVVASVSVFMVFSLPGGAVALALSCCSRRSVQRQGGRWWPDGQGAGMLCQ